MIKTDRKLVNLNNNNVTLLK